MKFNTDEYSIEIKGGVLEVSTGIVISDKICSMPVAIIPLVKWENDIQKDIVNALVTEKHYDIVAKMAGEPDKKTTAAK